MNTKKETIIKIILSVFALMNIVFMKFIWWKDNGIYKEEAFEDTDGWRYMELVGRKGFYILGLILIFSSIWLLHIIEEVWLSLVLAVIGSVGLIYSFFSSTANEYPLLNESAGNFTGMFCVSRIYAIVSSIIIVAGIIIRIRLKTKQKLINKH